MTLYNTLNYGNYSIFFTMGNAGFILISSTVWALNPTPKPLLKSPFKIFWNLHKEGRFLHPSALEFPGLNHKTRKQNNQAIPDVIALEYRPL